MTAAGPHWDALEALGRAAEAIEHARSKIGLVKAAMDAGDHSISILTGRLQAALRENGDLALALNQSTNKARPKKKKRGKK